MASKTIKEKTPAKKAAPRGSETSRRSRKVFYRHAETFFNLVETAAGKPLSDECVSFAMKRYAHIVWHNQPWFIGKPPNLKTATEQCCRDVGAALKKVAGSIDPKRFETVCLKQEKGLTPRAKEAGGICTKSTSA